MPEGTSPQEAIRARLLMAETEKEMRELSVDVSVGEELEDIEDHLEEIAESVGEATDCDEFSADVSLDEPDT